MKRPRNFVLQCGTVYFLRCICWCVLKIETSRSDVPKNRKRTQTHPWWWERRVCKGLVWVWDTCLLLSDDSLPALPELMPFDTVDSLFGGTWASKMLWKLKRTNDTICTNVWVTILTWPAFVWVEISRLCWGSVFCFKVCNFARGMMSQSTGRCQTVVWIDKISVMICMNSLN